MMKKRDICSKCGKDKNFTHERDGTYMCWCADDVPERERIKELLSSLGMLLVIRIYEEGINKASVEDLKFASDRVEAALKKIDEIMSKTETVRLIFPKRER